MDVDFSPIWQELEDEANATHDPASRVYRALGETAIGIRAGVIPREQILELLIEIPATWGNEKSLPAWRGMRFEVIPLSLPPRPDAHHLRLYLEALEHKTVFLAFCEDLVSSLEGISDAEARINEIEASIVRWGRFFEKCGPEGMSPTAQRGLFGELRWIQSALDAEIDRLAVVSSWKGCERGYHDFDLDGHVVEAKSTMTKEPRSVRISNERQLDDRGLNSLHLFVVTLHQTDGAGTTLPEQVQAVRDALASSPTAAAKFEHYLVSAGYLSGHANRYSSYYAVRKCELFRVGRGFPRIIDVPPGIGRLAYSLTLSACQSHEVDLHAHLTQLRDE